MAGLIPEWKRPIEHMRNAIDPGRAGGSVSLIRRAVQDDLTAIMRIEAIPAYYTLVGSWSEAEHRQALSSPDAAYWVSTQQSGEIEGFCIALGLRTEHRSVELKRIAVAVPGVGIGRRLLSTVCHALFTEYQMHRVWLDVFERNDRARHVYHSVGFREDGLLREAVYRDGAYHSLILMSVLDREFGPLSDASHST
ncbi:GNAT family N-acetyltransferase [Silvibacterium sp.]|uniref:GNAT family N-acetyltransferase n=1 Tax=Silvibacterium sp. TaxID=1964179 RepID=UPI0039E58ABC